MLKEDPGTSATSSTAGRRALISKLGDGVSPSPPAPRLPTGLKNLGATCYLNSQLQALFANKGFRDGVFSWRPSSASAASGACAYCTQPGKRFVSSFAFRLSLSSFVSSRLVLYGAA